MAINAKPDSRSGTAWVAGAKTKDPTITLVNFTGDRCRDQESDNQSASLHWCRKANIWRTMAVWSSMEFLIRSIVGARLDCGGQLGASYFHHLKATVYPRSQTSRFARVSRS